MPQYEQTRLKDSVSTSMTHTSHLLMVGCGKMGGALVKGWANMPDQHVTVVDPIMPAVPLGVELARTAAELSGRTFHAVIIAVKPQMVSDILADYTDKLRPAGAIISIAAGTPLAQFEQYFPDTAVIRMMPNLPALIGMGMTGLLANQKASQTSRDMAQRLADAVGRSLWVEDEAALDRLTAISGSGPAYLFQFMESFEKAATDLGFAEHEARLLVQQTLVGAARMAVDADAPPSELKQAVMSKGGTTEAAIHAMNRSAIMDQLMLRSVRAAFERAESLALGSHQQMTTAGEGKKQ